VWLLAATPALAQQVSDARVAELVKEALAQAQAAQAATQAPQTPRSATDLTMDDAVKRALEQNIDLGVERLNPAMQDLTVVGFRAAYRPRLTSTFGNQSSKNAGTRTTDGGLAYTSDTLTYNTGVAQALRWTGGTLNVNWNNNRTASTQSTTSYNPSYRSTFSASLSQPLLSGFRIDSARVSLLTGLINRGLADVSLRARTINTIASTRNAYWDLVYGAQAVDVARQSLSLAEKLVQDNRARVEIGTMAPIDVVQAEAQAAAARQSLVAAEATRRTTELTLKRLIVGSTQDALWNATINPTDRPPATESLEAINVEAAIRNALEKRTDLVTQREQLKTTELNLRLLKNQTMPGLDLTASFNSTGNGGPRLERTQAIGGTVSQIIPGGYVDALTTLRKLQFPTWNVQVQFSYPIGTSSQEASYARAKIQLQQTQAQMRSTELQVATDVTSAALAVQNSLLAVQAAAATRELRQRQLEAEQSKFDVGMSTNYQVVQFQRDLADALNSELRAILNYRKALVEFQRVQEAGR
jgi:outer membrane protein TolC